MKTGLGDCNRMDPDNIFPPTPPSGAPAPAEVTPTGGDSFFQSRGRLLMEAPLAELAGLAEQIIAQADALGHPQLVPEFKQLRDRARQLRARFLGDPSKIPEGAGTLRGEGDRSQRQTKFFLLQWLASQKPGSSPFAGQAPLTETPCRGRLLVVEDDPDTQELIGMLLQNCGYEITTAGDGAAAKALLDQGATDLVLLDLLLPEMNGYELLESMKAQPRTRDVPTIVLSGTADMDSVVRCIEMGAEDFLPKPFHPLLLRTRIAAGLEKKRLRDMEQAFLKQISEEREKSERLLLNVLPAAIAERLKQGEATIAESFPDVTVLFADLAQFTELSKRTPAPKLVELLNEVFSIFDRLAEVHGLEKIKTIGDNYMAVGGLPVPCDNHAERVARMALEMIDAIHALNAATGTRLSLRIGIHSGPVVAGIIGRRKFSYDLWGDTVNLASRMESHGQPGCIQVSEATRNKLVPLFHFESQGKIKIKGQGELPTYFLHRRPPVSA